MKKRKQIKRKANRDNFENDNTFGIDKVRSLRNSYNNVYEFASILSIPRDEVMMLNKNYLSTRQFINASMNKLFLGFEVLLIRFCYILMIIIIG